MIYYYPYVEGPVLVLLGFYGYAGFYVLVSIGSAYFALKSEPNIAAAAVVPVLYTALIGLMAFNNTSAMIEDCESGSAESCARITLIAYRMIAYFAALLGTTALLFIGWCLYPRPSGPKTRPRRLSRPYLWLTIMAAYILSLSVWLFVLPTAEGGRNYPSFEPYRVELGGYGFFWAFPQYLGIVGASIISIPSAIVVLLGKHRAAVPSLFALAIWLLVWIGFVSASASILPVVFLVTTILIILATVISMRRIGDMR